MPNKFHWAAITTFRLADSEASPVNGVLQVEETAGMMTIKGDRFRDPFLQRNRPDQQRDLQGTGHHRERPVPPSRHQSEPSDWSRSA